MVSKQRWASIVSKSSNKRESHSRYAAVESAVRFILLFATALTLCAQQAKCNGSFSFLWLDTFGRPLSVNSAGIVAKAREIDRGATFKINPVGNNRLPCGIYLGQVSGAGGYPEDFLFVVAERSTTITIGLRFVTIAAPKSTETIGVWDNYPPECGEGIIRAIPIWGNQPISNGRIDSSGKITLLDYMIGDYVFAVISKNRECLLNPRMGTAQGGNLAWGIAKQ